MLAVSAVFMNGSHGVLKKSNCATRRIGQHLPKVMNKSAVDAGKARVLNRRPTIPPLEYAPVIKDVPLLPRSSRGEEESTGSRS